MDNASGNPTDDVNAKRRRSSYQSPIVLDGDSNSSIASVQPPQPLKTASSNEQSRQNRKRTNSLVCKRKLEKHRFDSSTESESSFDSSTLPSLSTTKNNRPQQKSQQKPSQGQKDVIDLCASDDSSSSSSRVSQEITSNRTPAKLGEIDGSQDDKVSSSASNDEIPGTIAIPSQTTEVSSTIVIKNSMSKPQSKKVDGIKSISDRNRGRDFPGCKSSISPSICNDEKEQTKNRQKKSIINSEKIAADRKFSYLDATICWSCEIPLQSGVDTSNSFCTAAHEVTKGTIPFIWHVHSHPLLRVTTCSVCYDKSNAIEDDVQQLELEENPENIDTCCWCNGFNVTEDESESYSLILCDKCPRSFCQRCVARANGFGKQGDKVVQDLMSSDSEWSCIHCQPPEALKSMQDYLWNNLCGEQKNVIVNNSGSLQHESNLFEELNTAEDMLDEAELMLDKLEKDEQYIKSTRDEIAKELIEMNKEGKRLSENDMKYGAIVYLTDVEIDTLKERWSKQHERTLDAIGKIHEALEDIGFDLKQYYSERKGKSVNETLDQPSWVISADKEMAERERKIGADGFKGRDKNYRDIEDIPNSELQGIEEINTTEGSIKIMTEICRRDSDQWGTKNLTEMDVQNFRRKADPNDYKHLSELNIKVSNRTAHDHNNSLEEEEIGEKIVLGNNGLKYFCRKGVNRKRSLQLGIDDLVHDRLIPANRLSNSQVIGNQKKRRIELESSNIIPYQHSNLILSVSGKIPTNSVCVAKPLADVLKPHQVEGVKFMWNHLYEDNNLSSSSDGKETSQVKGCILSHHMGLGKSLQLVVILHTLMTNPLVTREEIQTCKRVLLTVPINTLSNWENEFNIWVNNKDVPKLNVLVQRTNTTGVARKNTLQKWLDSGGVLICPYKTLGSMCAEALAAKPKDATMQTTYRKAFLNPGPDLIVCDEGHLMLNNQNTQICRALMSMATKRRISLTGTPLQNNLKEYFTMANWIKPGCLGAESSYERKYCIPISNSLNSDSSESEIRKGEQLLQELDEKLSFIHRCNHQVLVKDLPSLQQVVIHVRQTKIQTVLYKKFQREMKRTGNNNFLEQYQKLFPVNNHPACLLFSNKQSDIPSPSNQPSTIDGRTLDCDHKLSSNNSCELDDVDMEQNHNGVDDVWWNSVCTSEEQMLKISNGGKVTLFLEILAHADLIGDKVILFSQCLKTLDFIEYVLNLPDWGTHVKSIEKLFGGKKVGSWKKNVEYLRLDGSTSAAERGDLVNKFNSRPEEQPIMIREKAKTENSKLFLISSKAGGIGINLTAANRVILFDSCWNPAIDLQAIHRSYRYGQQKPVYTYRLLTEGTMEEKVYSRGVNKKNLAARVLDQREFQRIYSSREQNDVMQIDTWVQCDRCEKWRMVHPSVETENLPEKWYCEMNLSDKARSNCDAEEKNVEFYRNFFASINDESSAHCTPATSNLKENNASTQSQIDHLETTKRDIILSGLVEISKTEDKDMSSRKKFKSLISKYYFQDDS